MNDIPSPLGWVETISVTDFPLPQIRPTITLSRWNLLYGKQCVGKTTLLELAASISNSKYAERFLGNENRLFEATLNYSTVDDYDKK
jgi:energy-coupling factor transporter ATP-binding protein EcfA2